MLSVQPFGSEFQVNSYTAGDQSLGDAANYAAASDADGDRVVVWSSLAQDGDSWGIFGQRFDGAGTKLGAEFRVNSTTAGAQVHPAVAIDADGDFVVAWASQGQDGSANGIYAQRFDAAGVRRGNEFRVNATTAGDQTDPAIASDALGNFVVAWSSPQDGDQEGIVARLFDSAGQPLTGETPVNSTSAGRQIDPVVTRTLAGDIVIAWTSTGQDGDAEGIVARRFDRQGAAVGVEIPVNQFTAGAQSRPALVGKADGSFIVAWQSAAQDGAGDSIVARRFLADGTPAANESIVNTTTAGDQRHPALALDATGGYVVAWTALGQDGDGAGVYAQAFAGDGTLIGSELRVNTTTAHDQERPTIALDADGDFVVAWQSANQDGDGLGVFAQRYSQSLADLTAPLASGIYLPGDTHRLTDGDRVLSAPAQLVVAFSEAMSTVGDATGLSSVLNPANYSLTLFGQNYSAAITSVTYGFNETTHRHEATLHLSAALPRGVYTLSVLPTIADAAGNLLDGDFDGATGGAMSLNFEVAEIAAFGPESQVNTTTAGDQAFTIGVPGTVAVDDAGNYVVTWASFDAAGTGWDIFAQRFNAAGAKQGGEFRVNTYTTNYQRFSTVAMDSDGDFVITWSSLGQDGSNYGVYAQRYDAAGNAVGGEFRVNTTTNKFQGRSTIAMDDDGDFVIAWESLDQDGSSVGIYYQRYAADGTKRGLETRANTITASAQRLPHVAMDNDGDFVITWAGPPDGSGYGIYARRFNADGVGQGPEFLANTLTAGNQQDSTVALDDDGDFVVAWHSSTGDGVFYGVYAQRFTAQGEKFGSQFLVNSFTANFQQFPSVGMDSNGDFVVTWQSLTQDGSVWGVYGQRYSWGGGRVGGEFQIHTTTNDSQNAPSVAMTPRGDFVVAWQSANQDGGGWGIYTQQYVGLTNTTPQAAIANPFSIAEGDPLSLDATASTDVDFGQSLTFTWDLNNDGVFGDAIGATPTVTFAELAALGIQDDGVYAVAVRVDDGYGGLSTASSTLTITNAAPSGLTLDPLAPINEGAGVLLTGLFVDPGFGDVHTLTVEWGDGTQENVTLAAGERTFQIAHTYRDDTPTGTSADTLAIRVTVADDDAGTSAPAETSLTVQNVAPLLEDLQFSKIVLDEGETFTISGRVSDAGADDTHTLSFVWADGELQTIAIDPVTRTFSVQYAYPDDVPTGTNQDLIHFTFTLTDDDLGHSVTDAAVTLRNVAPTITNVQLSASTIDEGGSVTVTGQLIDPGLLDVLTVNVVWGDGQTSAATVDPVTRMFTATHTYLDDNPTGTPSDVYTITLQAADDDLGASEAQATLTVTNVAPRAEIQITPEHPLGQREMVLKANVAEAGSSDTFTYAWQVLFNDQVVASGTAAELRFTPMEAGEYAIKLQVTDDDGGVANTMRTVTLCIVPGDANGDCKVDLVDLNLVRNYFGASRSDAEWQNFVGPLPGDVDGDDTVGLSDLNLVRNNFGSETPSTPAPLIATTTRVATATTPIASATIQTKLPAVDAVFAQFAVEKVAQPRSLGARAKRL